MLFAEELVVDLRAAGAPEDPDPEASRALAARYREDPGLRDEVILQFAFLAYNLARGFRSRNNADDILGEALLALVGCVSHWPEIAKDDNLRTYLVFSIKKRIRDEIDRDRHFLTPPQRAREMVARGEDLPCRVPVPEDLSASDPGTVDLEEFFESRADARDRILVEMRLAGKSVDEISAAIGKKGDDWVRRRFRILERAFSKMLNP